MKLTQLLPAPPGLQAVYVDVEKDKGLVFRPIVMFGLMADDDGDTFADALDYVFGEGYVPCAIHDDFLGILNPGGDIVGFERAEIEARAELGKTSPTTPAAN